MSEARLGFAIDSSPAANAASDLDKLTTAAIRTEQATEKASTSATKASRSFGDISPALERIIQGLEGLNKSAQSIDSRLDAMSKAATMAASTTVKLVQAANDAGKAVDSLGDKIRKVPDASRSFGDQAAHVVAFRSEIDRLTAKFQPLQTATKAYEASVAEINRAHRLGVISAEEMTAALTKEKEALDRLNNTPNPQPNQKPGLSEGNKKFIGRDLGFQAQDIITTAIGGMSPQMIAAQQGSQVAGALQGLTIKEAGGALVGAVSGLLSPLSLASVAFTGLAAAGIQWALGTSNQVKKLDDVLDDHAKYLKAVEDRYGSLAEKAKGLQVESASVLNFQGSTDARVVKSATNRAQADVFEQTGAILGRVKGGTQGGNDLSIDSDYKPIQDALRRLRGEAKAGKPDFDAFYDSLYKASAADPKFAKKADDLAVLVEKFREGTKALEEMQRIQRALFNDRGANGILLSQGTTSSGDMGNLAAYRAQQAVAAGRSNQAFYARLAGLDARSPAQKAAAARSEASSVYNNDEDPRQRNQRINQAGIEAYVRANKELADSARDRSLSMDATIRSQQQDISLVGKTGAAAEASRKEFELMAQVRSEAAKRGISDEQTFLAVYGKEIDLIKQNAAEYGRLAEARARAQLSADLSFKSDQFGRTPEQRSIAEQLKAAGLPVDLLSKSAKDISDANARDTDRTKGFNQEGFNAQLAGIRARTDAERVAAARAAAEAQHSDTEPDALRQQRITNAGNLAQAQIDKERSDAARDRSLSLDRMLTSQREELSLVEQTGGAAEGLRKQYELIAALQEESAKNGGIVSPAEIERIKTATAAYGEMVDKISLAKLNSDLDFQDRQFGRNPQQQQIASTLRQNGLPEDLNSPVAQRLKQQAQSQTQKEAIDQFSSNLASNLMASGKNIGKALGQTILSSLQESTTKALANIFDQFLKLILTGKSGGGDAGSAGVVGALGSKMLGGLGIGKGAANDNTSPSAATSLSGIGSALGFVGNYKSGVDSRLTDILSTAATKFPGFKVDAMSGFRAGDPRFHGQGLATDVQLTDMLSGKKLGNYQDAASFGTYEKFAQTARQVQMDKYPELANQFRWGGYFGGDKSKYGAMDEMHFDLGGNKVGMGGGSWANGLNSQQSAFFPGAQSMGMNDAAKAIDKLTTSSTDASQGLGQLGSGLGSLGSKLGSASPGAAGSSGGGLFGWLGSIFGGAFKPNGAQATLAASGKITGMFASGTDSAPGGMALVGEKGPELVNLPKGSQVIPNHKLGSMAVNGNEQSSQSQQPKYEIHIHGGSGDDHIRSLVNQGVQQADMSRSDQMRRGGYGQMQQRYGNQKG